MLIIIGFTVFEILYNAVFIIYYIVSLARNELLMECIELLFNLFMLYILYKIRDDIRADKSQLPPVYYDPEPNTLGSRPYPQLPQQDQQIFVPANPYYAQLPQQYSPVPANSSYPPTMQPQSSDPNICPPTIQPQPLGPNMFQPLPQQQLPQTT